MIAAPLGIVLMLALGAGLWRLAAPAPRDSADWTAMFGYSVALGLMAVGLAVSLPSLVGIVALPEWRWSWPLLPAALVWLLALRLRWFRHDVPRSIPAPLPPTWLLAVLLLIAVRFVWIVDEAWLRPLFGWDAWLAWSAKAKAWALAGEVVSFAPGPDWLALPAGSVRSSLAHHYPELLSWIEVWATSLAGGWSEVAVNLIWPSLWLALLAGCHGQWRRLGVSGPESLLALYALASLPLLNVHAALPGYADLWVGTCLAFAALAWLRWAENGERGQLLLAVLLVAALPLLKFEGMVWALAMLGLMLWFGLLRLSPLPRLLLIGAGAGIVLLASWLFELRWLETVFLLLQPAAAHHSTTASNVLLSVLSGLFAQANWHLLWYLTPLLLLLRWRSLRASLPLSGLALMVAGGLSLILLLFLFSQAGRWAESYTVVNRLFMHFAPTVVCLVVLSFRPGVLVRASAARQAPVSS